MAKNIIQKIKEGVLGLFGRKKEEDPQPLTLEEPAVPDAESRWTEEYEEFLEKEEGEISRQPAGEAAGGEENGGAAEEPASLSGAVPPSAGTGEGEDPGPELDEWEDE